MHLTVEQAYFPIDLPVFVVVVLYGGVVLAEEGLLDELDGHGALADATVANNNQLEM